MVCLNSSILMLFRQVYCCVALHVVTALSYAYVQDFIALEIRIHLADEIYHQPALTYVLLFVGKLPHTSSFGHASGEIGKLSSYEKSVGQKCET